ncbi:MAG: TatD family hydrolase [Pseudanabaenaceae cyanobacterium bins.68]|nr:TatD family hydrolase [Pseudanabaenaceae cyanobacterium bins.68]
MALPNSEMILPSSACKTQPGGAAPHPNHPSDGQAPQNSMRLVDTHVHINFPDYDQDLEAISQRWQAAGVVGLVHSCVKPAELPKTLEIAARFEQVFLAVGLHPLNAAEFDHNLAHQIYQFAQNSPRMVAIGETGLDFYKATNQTEQIQAFKAQLQIAAELDLAVIIHCRDAADTAREVLREFQTQGRKIRGVMHCWAGTTEQTQWFLDLGMYISFSGVVTFKNAKTIQASAALVPRDRLLIETDCPFLAPMPHRGQRNEPAYVVKVAEQLARLRQEHLEDVATYTTANANQLFNLGL